MPVRRRRIGFGRRWGRRGRDEGRWEDVGRRCPMVVVPPAGFEPATRGSEDRCSDPLSYGGETATPRTAVDPYAADIGEARHDRAARPAEVDGAGFEPATRSA